VANGEAAAAQVVVSAGIMLLATTRWGRWLPASTPAPYRASAGGSASRGLGLPTHDARDDGPLTGLQPSLRRRPASQDIGLTLTAVPYAQISCQPPPISVASKRMARIASAPDG
jgi:hypothetical protein